MSEKSSGTYRTCEHVEDPAGRTYVCEGCATATVAAALADAAALRERLGRVSNEVLRLTNQVAHLGMDLATAEALALTNGAERDELRGLLERFVAMTPRSLDLGRLPFAEWHDYARVWLASHPAIPEGTPGEGEGRT